MTFLNILFLFMISLNIAVQYYQENKDYKKARERYQMFLRKKKKKSDNMVVNNTKIYQKMKSKSLLSIEKNMQ